MSTYMTPYEKVKSNSYTPRHMRALAMYLSVNISNVNGFYLGGTKASSYDDHDLADFITTNWTSSQVHAANDVVRATYDTKQKRGRPFGSKNRPKENVNPLDIIEDFAKNGDDGDEDEHLEEIKASRDTDKYDNRMSTRDDIAQEVTKTFAEFLRRYEQAHDEHSKFLAESFLVLEEKVIKRLEALKPNVIELKRNALPTINLGVQHKSFEKLLKMCTATMRNGQHLNIWIYGPAGTGKSTAAEKVAEALGLKFYTDGKMVDETKVLGYQDASGTYRTTNFRQAYEFGGVYLTDEIDGSLPDALLALNGALANGHCSFPDKIVTRHSDFVMLAAANTTGTGGTIEYVGRFQQDAAFTDRWVFIDWPLDEALEDSLVANKEWLAAVRHTRAKLKLAGIKGHLITPRASIYGETLLASGLNLETVKDMLLKKGLSEAQWNQIK